MPSLNAIPNHIAIIMDGNGRWATQKGYMRTRGHREGAKRVDEIVTKCREIGVNYLTLYAFSTENWKRPTVEVNTLMHLLVQHLKTMDKKLLRNQVQLQAKGDLSQLPKYVRRELDRVVQITSMRESQLVLTLCLSYGGRQEIVDSAKAIAEKVAKGQCAISDINENYFREHLYQPKIPDPDLLIRTGGECRVSNFLLWEIAYSEIYVTEICWPDFNAEQLGKAISSFGVRERRFGKTSQQLRDQTQEDRTV